MHANPASPQTLSFEDARHLVEEHAAKLGPCATEEVELLEGVNRVLAEPIHADRDFPPFPRAARDGYAIRAAELAQVPTQFDIRAEIRAGADRESIPALAPGQTVAIMTGAAAPPAADAVVMVEYTRRRGNRVEVLRGIQAGENIVAQGSEARRGDLLVAPGSLLDEAAIAVAASVGKARVRVYQKPTIAVLATGDEIINIEAHPGPTQVRNSNTYSLAAQILVAGAKPVRLPVAADQVIDLRKLIGVGLKYDMLLLAGGVSAGKYDLVEQVLAELGAEFFFTGAQIQPGKPIVFGRVGEKYFFGLPGNPVSTMVTFELFATPIVEALMGLTAHKLVFLHARLKREVTTKTGLRRFLPAYLSGEFERAEVELADWHGSGDIVAAARANCYLVVSPDRQRIAVGESVPVLMRKSAM